ncbi:MAG: exo-alpha-sialidase [Planctomycetota bacterium]|nr:MAG: exo-alpha-sialidase [Planctomycetota bacterium]
MRITAVESRRMKHMDHAGYSGRNDSSQACRQRRTVQIALTIACGALWLVPATDSSAAEPEVSIVWESGKDGYHTYRIPAVLTAANGDLLAFCEGRRNSARDHGNLDLLQKRSTDGGRTWSEQEVIHEEGGEEEITIGNPCPVLDRETGVLWMPFTRNNDHVFMMHSDDHGETWSEPADITQDVKRDDWGWYATGPGVGIQLTVGDHAGRLVIPCDHRSKEYDCGSHVIYSDDHGKTWTLSENTVYPGSNECQVVELADGRLMLNSRMQSSRETGQRGVSFSDDGGETWSPLSQESGLKDPAVQASFLRLKLEPGQRGNVLLFSNPDVPQRVERGRRVDLTVRASFDEAETWPHARLLHPGPAAYSCLVALPEDNIGCLYEAGDENAYETIRFARFNLDWLTGE